MIITSLIILIMLVAIISPLRNIFYIFHIFLVILVSWAADTNLDEIKLFSIKSIQIFLILHLISINFITFIAYYYDKIAARKHKWRIPEKTLLALALIGGTPAATMARKIFRHKTKKKSFRIHFWIVILLQISSLVVLAYLQNNYK